MYCISKIAVQLFVEINMMYVDLDSSQDTSKYKLFPEFLYIKIFISLSHTYYKASYCLIEPVLLTRVVSR